MDAVSHPESPSASIARDRLLNETQSGPAAGSLDGALASRIMHIQQRQAGGAPAWSVTERQPRKATPLIWLGLPAVFFLIFLIVLVSRLVAQPKEAAPLLLSPAELSSRVVDVESTLDVLRKDTDRLDQGLSYSLDQIETLYQKMDQVTLALENQQVRTSHWIQERNPNHFSIQLIGARSQVNLQKFAEFHGEALSGMPVFILEGSHEGQPWYSLYVGDFEDASSAERTMQTLPQVLRDSGPWVRRIGNIRGDTAIANGP